MFAETTVTYGTAIIAIISFLTTIIVAIINSRRKKDEIVVGHGDKQVDQSIATLIAAQSAQVQVNASQAALTLQCQEDCENLKKTHIREMDALRASHSDQMGALKNLHDIQMKEVRLQLTELRHKVRLMEGHDE